MPVIIISPSGHRRASRFSRTAACPDHTGGRAGRNPHRSVSSWFPDLSGPLVQSRHPPTHQRSASSYRYPVRIGQPACATIESLAAQYYFHKYMKRIFFLACRWKVVLLSMTKSAFEALFHFGYKFGLLNIRNHQPMLGPGQGNVKEPGQFLAGLIRGLKSVGSHQIDQVKV